MSKIAQSANLNNQRQALKVQKFDQTTKAPQELKQRHHK
jgi:hypothetical protein